MGRLTDAAMKAVRLDSDGNIVDFRGAVAVVARKEDVSEEVATIAVAFAAVQKRGGWVHGSRNSLGHHRQAHSRQRGGEAGVS